MVFRRKKLSACNEGKPAFTTLNNHNIHTRVCTCVRVCVCLYACVIPDTQTEEIKLTHPTVGLTSHPAEHTGGVLLRRGLQKVNEIAAWQSYEGCWICQRAVAQWAHSGCCCRCWSAVGDDRKGRRMWADELESSAADVWSSRTGLHAIWSFFSFCYPRRALQSFTNCQHVQNADELMRFAVHLNYLWAPDTTLFWMKRRNKEPPMFSSLKVPYCAKSLYHCDLIVSGFWVQFCKHEKLPFNSLSCTVWWNILENPSCTRGRPRLSPVK